MQMIFCEISSSHGGEYDVQSCLSFYTAVQPWVDNHFTRQYNPEVDNHFTRQYNPEDSSEHQMIFYRFATFSELRRFCVGVAFIIVTVDVYKMTIRYNVICQLMSYLK
jgi:hypothetical protein